MKKILVVFIILTLLISVAGELASKTVYGRLGSKQEVEEWFSKHPLSSYHLNIFDNEMFQYDNVFDEYIAKEKGPVTLSKWNIHDVGRIPRWSNWSKKLDERREELMKTQVDLKVRW